jgi:hypothetical protein
MTIDVTQQLKDLEGKPLKEAGKDVILRDIVNTALLASFPDERNLPGKEKQRRYKLACRIMVQDKPDLELEDVTLVKRLVGEAYSPLIVGQAWDMLEAGDRITRVK